MYLLNPILWAWKWLWIQKPNQNTKQPLTTPLVTISFHPSFLWLLSTKYSSTSTTFYSTFLHISVYYYLFLSPSLWIIKFFWQHTPPSVLPFYIYFIYLIEQIITCWKVLLFYLDIICRNVLCYGFGDYCCVKIAESAGHIFYIDQLAGWNLKNALSSVLFDEVHTLFCPKC